MSSIFSKWKRKKQAARQELAFKERIATIVRTRDPVCIEVRVWR